MIWTSLVALKPEMHEVPEVPTKPIDPKFHKDIEILNEFIKSVLERRCEAKYCLSFLNSTENTAKKQLRDLYKGGSI